MTQCLRIAVADDEPDMRDYYSRILPRLGHRVVGVSATGAELLDRCRQVQPDLVITDRTMPDMDGLEAAVLLVRDQSTPVIVVTAQPDPDLCSQGSSYGGMAYLHKPIRQADLPPAISLAFNRFEQWQARRGEAIEADL